MLLESSSNCIISDAFFTFGTSGPPSGDGMRVPNERGSTEKLPIYRLDASYHVVISLPTGLTVNDIAWFNIWCYQATVRFLDVIYTYFFWRTLKQFELEIWQNFQWISLSSFFLSNCSHNLAKWFFGKTSSVHGQYRLPTQLGTQTELDCSRIRLMTSRLGQ